MSPRRRKFDVRNEREAIMAISAGVTFFAIRKPIKTGDVSKVSIGGLKKK